MCRCYHCRWGQPYYTNGGYWHKCICFTCRTVGSRGTTEMNIYILYKNKQNIGLDVQDVIKILL